MDYHPQARELARDDLIKVLTYQSGSAVEWLMDRFNLDLAEVSRLGGHSFERTHRPAAGGTFPVRVAGHLATLRCVANQVTLSVTREWPSL